MTGKPTGLKKSILRVIRSIHKWLGLASGIVVFIVAMTGCCWVFQEEIRAMASGAPEIEVEEGKDVITPSKAKEVAHSVYPSRRVHGTLYAHEAGKPVEVIFYEEDPEFYRSAFIHPISEEVIRKENHLSGFFPFILDGHLHLWLPEHIGSKIVSYATLVFVLMLITGIVLWWPGRKNRKKRLSFQWTSRTRWRRKNFDLHAIFGFYASFFALLIAFTGLIMAFKWMENFTYSSLGGEKSTTFTIPENTSGALKPSNNAQPIDALVTRLKKRYPQAESYEVHYPPTDSSAIYVEISHEQGVSYSNDFRFYDQNTLKELSSASMYGPYSKAGLPATLLRMDYDIHVGRILNLPGKILAFLTSLTIASLPVTGIMMWWGRRKKRRRSNRSTSSVKHKQTEEAYHPVHP